MTERYANWSARGRAPTDDERRLRTLVTDGDERAKRNAALALVDHAADGLNDATVTALSEAARTADDPDVRQFAVEALGIADAGTAAVRDALCDEEEWVRAEAVVARSRQGATAAALERVLEDDDSGWVRRNALIALAKVDALDQPVLAEVVHEDPHESVREYAADFLGDAATDAAAAVDTLRETLRRDPSAFVRAKAASSLADLGTEEAIEILEIVADGDPSEDVRRTAKRSISQARGRGDPGDVDVNPADRAPTDAEYGDPTTNL